MQNSSHISYKVFFFNIPFSQKINKIKEYFVSNAKYFYVNNNYESLARGFEMRKWRHIHL